jgi:hypothetical protein
LSIWKIGLSTPADIECSHARLLARNAEEVSRALRPGIVGEERDRDPFEIGVGNGFFTDEQHRLDVRCNRPDLIAPCLPERLGAKKDIAHSSSSG